MCPSPPPGNTSPNVISRRCVCHWANFSRSLEERTDGSSLFPLPGSAFLHALLHLSLPRHAPPHSSHFRLTLKKQVDKKHQCLGCPGAQNSKHRIVMVAAVLRPYEVPSSMVTRGSHTGPALPCSVFTP